MSSPVGYFDLEIALPGRTARPFRVSSVMPARAREIIDSFLAAYGVQTPRDLQDIPEFAQQLLTTGEYRYDSDEIRILVKGFA